MRFVVLMTLLAAYVSAADLTGDWVAHYRVRDAQGWERLYIEQSGSTLKGRTEGVELTGTLKGDAVVLEGKDFRFQATVKDGALTGRAQRFDDDLEFSAARVKAVPATPTVHTFEPKEFHRLFSGAIEPVLHIFPGDTVKTWTVDAGGRDAQMRKLSNGGNPETGPFYIEGALPGDQIAVTLKRVRLNRDSAFSGDRVTPSALNPRYFASLEKVKDFDTEWALDREHGIARIKKPTEALKEFTVPLRPMMGCLGVAPGGDMVFRSGFLGGFGGNMDYNEVREGATIYLAVNKPGALLFIGDGHAAQGDGELTGDALETSMDVEFTVRLIPDGGKGQNSPHVESEEHLMAMGIAGSLNDALQAATTELSRWLAKDYGLNPSEMGMVLGSSIRYDIAEVVDPYVNVVAKISKKALAPLKRK